jgi:hypothetical protein
MRSRCQVVPVAGALCVLAGLLLPSLSYADDAACIAASEQSLTLRQQGKLHDALKQLAACADASCPGEVKLECAKRIGDVDAAMPTLVLAATDGAGNDLRDVKVSMDGAPLAASLDGRPIKIDPGEHTFRFEENGQPPVDKKLVLREGDKDRRESVVLGPPPPAPTPAPAHSPDTATPGPSWWTTQRTLAVVGGGLGVVGLALGGVFGGLAIGDQNMEKSNCSSSGCSNRPQAQADYNTGGDNATASTVSFIAGGALLAAGAVLFFTAKDPVSTATTGRLYLAPSTTGRGPGLVLGGEL